jgi:hypothetical protein
MSSINFPVRKAPKLKSWSDVAKIKYKGSHITESNLDPANNYWRGNVKEMKNKLTIRGSMRWVHCQSLTQELLAFNFTPQWLTPDMIKVRDEYQEAVKAGVPYNGVADKVNQFWYVNFMGDLLFIPPAGSVPKDSDQSWDLFTLVKWLSYTAGRQLNRREIDDILRHDRFQNAQVSRQQATLVHAVNELGRDAEMISLHCLLPK